SGGRTGGPPHHRPHGRWWLPRRTDPSGASVAERRGQSDPGSGLRPAWLGAGRNRGHPAGRNGQLGREGDH
ncbi:hypothetical protein ABTM87_20265, partial [Acinetobacter baumannii]